MEFALISKQTQSPIIITGAAIVIEFRHLKKSGTLVKRISLGDGIEMVNALEGKFAIDAFALDFPIGQTFYDCLITISGVGLTYFEGTIEIDQNVTNP
jgi:hypothetical protein